MRLGSTTILRRQNSNQCSGLSTVASGDGDYLLGFPCFDSVIGSTCRSPHWPDLVPSNICLFPVLKKMAWREEIVYKCCDIQEYVEKIPEKMGFKFLMTRIEAISILDEID